MDFIPRLRAMGEKELATHLETKKNFLLEIVEGRWHSCLLLIRSVDQNFSFPLLFFTGKMNVNPDVVDSSAAGGGYNDEEGGSMIIRELGSLKRQWNGVLQEAVYERVMGYLLECVLRTAMRPVLDADCVSESSGGEVCRIFRSFQKVKATMAAADDEAMTKLSASWVKFCALTDLLEYRSTASFIVLFSYFLRAQALTVDSLFKPSSLSEISEMLSKGKFSSFTVRSVVTKSCILYLLTPPLHHHRALRW